MWIATEASLRAMVSQGSHPRRIARNHQADQSAIRAARGALTVGDGVPALCSCAAALLLSVEGSGGDEVRDGGADDASENGMGLQC